jgi:hypothetical protein
MGDPTLATAQLRGPIGDLTDSISNIDDGDFADQAKISEMSVNGDPIRQPHLTARDREAHRAAPKRKLAREKNRPEEASPGRFPN